MCSLQPHHEHIKIQTHSVFSVWRPTSIDSIEKMMKGHGVGKGLDIKGKSAKKGKLSAYVPFLQIHQDEHKSKIRALPSGGRIRVFYKKEAPRDKAHDFLTEVRNDMVKEVEDARQIVKRAMEDTLKQHIALLNGSGHIAASLRCLQPGTSNLHGNYTDRDVKVRC